MIYTGNYNNGVIYGTLNNDKIIATTSQNANFLSCELQVVLGGTTWSHTFDIPFFENKAEFFFDNYIHSIITQKFNKPALDTTAISFSQYNLASVTMTLKEMQQNTVLDTLTRSFFITLGKISPILLSAINTGFVAVLPTKTSQYITQNGVICVSFIANALPTKLNVNNGVTNTVIDLTVTTVTNKLHTICIPVKAINSVMSTHLKLSLNFGNTYVHNLGDFNIIDDDVDHNLVAFQNLFGTLSVFEFLGELKEDWQYSAALSETTTNKNKTLNVSDIERNTTYAIKTGYWMDEARYNLLDALLKSFNIFIVSQELKEIVLSSRTRITPYKSNFYENNETINFKLSSNDNSIYGVF